MQQIEEIRRMSELAKQMRELGLAKDNSDAFNQARSITSSDPEVASQRKQDELTSKVAMLERKLESQQRSIDDLRAQLGAGGKSLAAAMQQIKSFDTKIRDLEAAGTANLKPIPPSRMDMVQPGLVAQQQEFVQPVQWPTRAPQPQWNQAYGDIPHAAEPAMPQMRTQERPASTAPIDRTGVAPADVSVEKFFYFGNKR